TEPRPRTNDRLDLHRLRPWPLLCLRPRGRQDAFARETLRAYRSEAARPGRERVLQGARRPRDSVLLDAAARARTERTAARSRAPWRTVPSRRMVLRLRGAVPRESRLRRAAAELSRLHRIRQSLRREGRRTVGPRHAGRHRRWRQVARRAR